MRIRIVSANLFQLNKTPARGIDNLVKALKPWFAPNFIGCQETRFSAPGLSSGKYASMYKNADNTHYRSNAILVKRGMKDVTYTQYTGAPGIKGNTPDGFSKTAKPRTIDVVTARKGKYRFAFINTHCHTIEEDRVKHNGRLDCRHKQYKRHVERVISLVKKYRSEGYIVMVTADNNAHPLGDWHWEWSLYRALSTKAGLTVWRRGVDLIAWDSKRLNLNSKKTVSKRLTGSDDHDALAVNLSVLR